MEITRFEPSHKASLKINPDKIIESGRHVPRKRTGGMAPRKNGEEPKYKPLRYETEKLNKAFENLATWCINGKVQKLKMAIKKPICRDLLLFKYECIDSKTGHNIVEFAAISGHDEIMKILLEHQTDGETYLEVGRALKYAIILEKVNIVKCMLEVSRKKSITFGLDGYGTLDDLCFAIEMDKIKIVEVFLEYVDFTNVYYRYPKGCTMGTHYTVEEL